MEAKRPQRGPKREAALEQLPARAAPKRRAVNPPTTSASDKALPNRPTPSKERSLAQFRTTTKRKTELSHGGKEDDLPAWIQPMIRALCAALEAKGAAPHVLAGVTSVLTLPSPRPDGPNPRKGMLPGLVIAVFIMTRTRLLGVQTSGKEYVGLRRHFMDTLIELRDDKEVKAKVAAIQKGKKAWEGWEKFGGRDVDGWLLELSSKGWTELDWFNNMQNGVGMDLPEVAEPEDDDANADIGDDGGQDFGGPLRGIGSMLNDRVDYLSARKKEDYAVWAASVMKRVQAIYIAQGNKDAPLQHFT